MVDVLPFPLEKWEDKELFNAVVCYHVLPHLGGLDKAEDFVSLLADKVKKGGFLFLSYPFITDVRIPTEERLLSTSQVGGVRYFHYSKLEALKDGVWETTWRFVTEINGKTICELIEPFEFTPFHLDQFDDLLQRKDIEIVDCFSSASGEAFSEEENTAVWLVLRKKS